MKIMKIVFVSNTYWPSKNGVQMVNQYLAEGLVEKGHEVIVLTCQLKKKVLEEEVYNGVFIKRFDISYSRLRGYRGDIKSYQAYLKKLDDSGKMEVMITVCANSFAGICTYPVMRHISAKKVIYNHGMRTGKINLDKITSFKSFAKEIICTMRDKIFYTKNWKYIIKYDEAIHLFYHDSSFEYFEKHGFKHNHVILNTCEKKLFSEIKSDVKNRNREIQEKYCLFNPYYVYIANFCVSKDQQRAIDAFYRADIQDIDLVLIGTEKNSYCDSLIRKVELLRKKNSNHGKVHILFDIDRDDTIYILKESYACIMSSMNEYFPITIIEAMAAGKPYISTNVGVVACLPGGNIVHNTKELVYWLEFYAKNKKYVNDMGKVAFDYAKSNLLLEDKVEQLELILKQLFVN